MTTEVSGWLDWRGNSVGPARPCRICTQPAICRDDDGRPCHKVCAERHPTDTADSQDALVVDLAAYRATRDLRSA